MANSTASESGVTPKLHVMNLQVCRLDSRKNFYNARIVNAWNSLPESVKSAKSTNEFKNLYDNHAAGEKTNSNVDGWKSAE